MPENQHRLLHESLESRLALTAIGFESQIVDSLDAVGPISLQAADLDGDGKQDLVVGSVFDSEVSWYRNEGEGLFGPQRVIADQGSSPSSVQATDLDGDGDLDVLVSADGPGDELVWFENTDGLGNFVSKQRFGVRSNHAESADLDGDGDLDVVSASSFGVIWYENLDGAGTFDGAFDTLQYINKGDNGRTVSTADFDGDGDLDIVAAFDPYFDEDTVVWYENIGGSKFDEAQVISAQIPGPRDLVASDVDGDGDADVILTSASDGKIVWHENMDGKGTFDSEQIITIELANVYTLDVADFDGDGDLDLVAAQYSLDNVLAWYDNTDGEGTFGSAQVITTDAAGVTTVFAADLDGDGDQDIASASFGDEKIAWYKNVDGNGTFGPQRVISDLGETALSVRAADIDGDGDKDLVTATYKTGLIGWYENIDGKGAFGELQIIDAQERGPSLVQAADFDGDGDLDVLADAGNVNSGSVAWYENIDGRGTFGPPIEISVGGVLSYVDDIDSDGDPDVLYQHGGNVVWVKNTDGAGSFGPVITITSGNAVRTTRAADLDGDGDKDILLAAASNAGSKIAWVENIDGSGTFGSEIVVSTEINFAVSAVPTDIDGDGDQDIVSALFRGDLVVWFENDGQAGFGEPKVVTAQVDGPRYAETTDLDGDGDQDVISLSADKKLAWYENEDGRGTFGNQKVISMQTSYRRTLTTDLDNDGDQDVVAYSMEFGIAWYENRPIGDSNGDGVFNSGDLVTVFQASEYEDGIANNSTFSEGDWNNDGEFNSSDLVLAFTFGTYSRAAKIYAAPRAAVHDSVFALKDAMAWVDDLEDLFVHDDRSTLY